MGAGDCPVQIMESWQDNMEHRFVIKHVQRNTVDSCDSDQCNEEKIQHRKNTSDSQRYIRQQDFMKKTFLTTMLGDRADTQIITFENDSDSILTESDEDENQRDTNEDFMSTSEEEDDDILDSLIKC